jgi:hypothetical protein
VLREAKSSYYTDTLKLVGYGDTLSHEVKIYSVGRNERKSEPISMNIKPLTPPVKSLFQFLTLDATFGGVIATFDNNFSQADLSLIVICDSTGSGTWFPITTYYTSSRDDNFIARGIDTVQRKFGLFIRDHWNNYSDTLFKVLKPYYEIEIPKNLFKGYHLPTDLWMNANPSYPMENIWNGKVGASDDIFSQADRVLPKWFTIDLGREVVLSRLKLYQRIGYPYAPQWIQEFEIWGSNSPAVDGSWDSWQLLGGPFQCKKPSGLPGTQYTAEDLAYVAAGEDFMFPAGLPSVRYVRFKMLMDVGGDGRMIINELTFFGQVN